VANLYGIKTFLEEKSVIYNRFFGTPYIYQAIRKLLRPYSQKNYIFTVQDCSLFNGKLSGIPHFVYTDHTVLANRNYPGYNPKTELLSESWMKLEACIYKDSDMVLTRSINIRNSVVKDYCCDPRKVRCIYYAPFFEGRVSDGGNKKYSSKNILFVGLEWERKGGPILVNAFERVLKNIPDASLTIVGCKPNIKMQNVVIAGKVSKDRLQEFYENCAVFCLPTQREPFGIVFLEAMSYRLPVIGVNIGALPEFILDGENGYLIDAQDVNKLSNLLIQLLSSPKICEQMGNRGYEIFHKKFTLEIVSSLLKESIESKIL
jgi:glycosyltransferase involved in cell wall biosynthesis